MSFHPVSVRRVAMAAGITALILATLPVLAQSGAQGFVGHWLRDPQQDQDGQPLPRVVLQVTMDGTTLVVDTRLAETGKSVRTVRYRLEQPEADDDRPADSTERTFRVLGPQRLELHDFSRGQAGPGMAMTEYWELREDGNVFLLRCAFRLPESIPVAIADQTYSFHRKEQ